MPPHGAGGAGRAGNRSFRRASLARRARAGYKACMTNAASPEPALERTDLMPLEPRLCLGLRRFFNFTAHSLYFPREDTARAEYLPEEEKLFVPLRAPDGELLGVFAARGVSAAEAGAVLPQLPAIAATCLENLQLYKQSRIEPVSGLLNRRSFLEAVGREIAGLRGLLQEGPEAGREGGRQFSLMAVRLGGLAGVVREEGYLRTDELIAEIGRALEEITAEIAPQPAVSGRSGDYEFSMLLPGYSPASAQALGAKAVSRLAEAHIRHPLTGKKIRISPSAGHVSCPRDLDGLDRQDPREQARQLLRRARLASAVAAMNARPEVPPEAAGKAVLPKSEAPMPVMAYGNILREGGRVVAQRPISRLTVSLGRTAGARPGQVFTVWGYALGGQGLLSRRYKADIMLIEVYEGEALAEIIHVDDASFPPESGDFLTLGASREHSAMRAHYPDDQPAGNTEGGEGGVDFLPRWSLMREKYDAFALVLGRFSLLNEAGDDAEAGWEALMSQALQKCVAALGPEALAGRFALNSLIFFVPNPPIGRPETINLTDALEKLGRELKSSLGLDSAFGIAPHPFLDFHKADSLENAKKALEYATLLPEPHIGVLDSLALNISADRKSSLGDQLGAIHEYRQALICDPGNILAWNSLGVVLAGLGQYKEARESLEEALSRVPDDHNTLYNLGNLQQSRRDYAGAKAFYLRCLELEPANVFTLYRLGQLCEQQEDFNGAEDYYRRAAGLPQGAALTRRSLARLSMRRGRLEEARETLHEALAQNPYDALAMQLLAGLYLDAGEDVRVAESLARQSVTLRPDLRASWLELARALEASGRKEDAREALIRAGEL